MTAVRYLALAEYHVVYIAPLDTSPIGDYSPTALLQVVGVGTSLVLFSGIHSGPLWITVASDEASLPPAIDEPAWEESAEVELNVTENLYMSSPTGDFVPSPTGLTGPIPVFVPTHPGPHRVLAFSRGREEERGNSLLGPGPEEHLLIVSAAIPAS